MSSDAAAGDDEGVEDAVRREQADLNARAKAVVFPGGDNVVERFKDARRIELQYQKARVAHDWVVAYYQLRLYLEIALRYQLHKQRGNARFAVEAESVLDKLERIQGRIDVAKKGML